MKVSMQKLDQTWNKA